MNVKLWITAAIVAVIASGPVAEGVRKKAPKKKDDLNKPDKDLDKKERAERDFQRLRDIGLGIEAPKEVESLTDDMEKLDEQVTLTEKQKTKISTMRTARDRVMANWEKANRKKFDLLKAGLEKLESRRDMKKCKAIVSRLQSMAKMRNSIVTAYERKFFVTLTPDQRGKWNSPILSEVLIEEFSSLELTDDQTKKIETVATTQAKRLAVPLGSGAPPTKLTGPIMKYVYTRILTTAQRKAYALAKRREKASGSSL